MSARDAPTEIQEINGLVSNWRPQLQLLERLLNRKDAQLTEDLMNGGILHVRQLVDELNETLAKLEKPNIWMRFMWPITTKDQIQDLYDQLEKRMSVILAILDAGDTMRLKDMRDRIEEIDLLTTSEHERRNILEWLKPGNIDAHETHRHKRALREEGTCDWLVDSNIWRDWCQGGSAAFSRFLWIHGLPGAGKTVLASFAIDDVAGSYQHKGVSFYYCSHERQKKEHTSSEEACSFLRWVIRDLTAQVTRPVSITAAHHAIIPKILKDLYDKNDFLVNDLLDCLLSVTRYISNEFKRQIYIIVDAVDESPSPRSELLRILTTIGADSEWKHVSLCFTSRKETEITAAIDAIQPPDETRKPSPLRVGGVGDRVILQPKSPSKLLESPSRRSGTPRPEPATSVPRGPDGCVINVLAADQIESPRGRSLGPKGFDGGSTNMLAADQMEHSRGRLSSWVSSRFPSGSQKKSRSENRKSFGNSLSAQDTRERSMSLGGADDVFDDDPMEIDSSHLSDSRSGRKGCTILSMDNVYVVDAIRTFVRNQLKDRPAFQRWSEEDLNTVIEELAKRARGMFRWAACQVDHIIKSKLCDKKSIMKRLDRMPSDIFGTYERTIADLLPEGEGQNDHNRSFARTALALICSPSSSIPCAEVLVEASRFNVPFHSALEFKLPQLEEVLGCLITVTSLRRPPESIYNRDKRDGSASKRVSVAHYTVKEYLFDEAITSGEAKYFALSTEATQILELHVIFRGLKHFGSYRPHDMKHPTRYEEYCLKMTDKALKERRDLILQDKTVWQVVTECLKWDSRHHQPKLGAFPNLRIRKSFPNWQKTSPFESGAEPKNSETSILVSLMLLQWPELAKDYLSGLPAKTKRKIWRDHFQLSNTHRVDGTEPETVMQLCVTRRDTAFLQTLIESRVDVSSETNLVMDVFFHAYGHKSLDDEDGGAKTGQLLKMLLERGVRPDAPDYTFTPLQFAVTYLEDGWVQALLQEGADPNGVGDAKGEFSFGKGKDEIQGHLTPLQICKETEPEGLSSDLGDDLMTTARDTVEFLLRQWGAKDDDRGDEGIDVGAEDPGSVIVIDE